MLRSMTGYGRAAARDGEAGPCMGLTVEIRAVNHRYLDVGVRLPRALSFLEDAVKRHVSGGVSRGKVEVSLSLEREDGAVEISVSAEAAAAYIDAARRLEERHGVRNDLTASALLRMPEVALVRKADWDEEETTAQALALAGRALEAFNAMRAQEGGRLKEDILQKAGEIERLVGLAEPRSPVAVEAYRARLEQKIRETLANTAIEESRLLTEVAIFSDKVSVSEETVRLRSHLAALLEILETGGPVGRKLDFLAQELGREANTIGSKGNDAEMGRIVVDMKTEIEKIREQVQNIE
ncbi:MAG: YicC family protein [Oscillospiraceae bacterium]|nr:YicC family protein [Oscillospiraceae bacterium]